MLRVNERKASSPNETWSSLSSLFISRSKLLARVAESHSASRSAGGALKLLGVCFLSRGILIGLLPFFIPCIVSDAAALCAM